MTHTSSWSLTCRVMLGAAAVLFISETALANDLPPTAPKIDCSKPANKNKAACKPHAGALTNDEIYNAAYWLAHDGRYGDALAFLRRAHGAPEARLLTETGFVTRKLGDVDGALAYYREALALDPGSTLTREYLGEAFVTKGDLAAARTQLGEIEKRCGPHCVDYVNLSQAISSAGPAQTRGG